LRLEIGVLASIDVRFERSKSHQSHYRIRYQLEASAPRMVQAHASSQQYLIATIRDSQIGDSVCVHLSDDETEILGWVNSTEDGLLSRMGRTWAEAD